MSSSRRGARPEGTFYFQAWHVDKVVGGESWTSNKEMADYVEQNLSPESKRWLCIKACIPTKSKPSLAVPYSICVKRRAAKINEEDESEQCIINFRDKEYPNITKRYFLTRLRKTLDFFNAYSEGLDADHPLANFTEVKSSKQLSSRVHAIIRLMKKDSLGDIVDGLMKGRAAGSEFKASKFITKRGQDPAKQDPHVLPTEPLQTILLSSGHDMRYASQESFQQMDDASSVGSAHSDDTTATSVSGQSAEQAEEVEERVEEREVEREEEEEQQVEEREEEQSEAEDRCSAQEFREDSSAIDASSDSEVEELVASTASHDRKVVRRTSDAVTITTTAKGQYQMAHMMTRDAQISFINVQNPRKLLQSMMSTSKTTFNLPKGMDFLNSPMVFATSAGSPLQSLQPDGTMRLFFLSKAKKSSKRATRSGRKAAGKKGDADDKEDEEEWVVGSVKLSTRPRESKSEAKSTACALPLMKFLPLLPETRPAAAPVPAIAPAPTKARAPKEDLESWEVVEEKHFDKTRLVEIKEDEELVSPHHHDNNKHKHHGHRRTDSCDQNCFAAHRGKPRRKAAMAEHEKRLFSFETNETKSAPRVVEQAHIETSFEKKERSSKSRRSSAASTGRTLRTKRTMDSISSTFTTATTATTSSHMSSQSSSTTSPKYKYRENWRSEPQPPELFCDVVNGANFMQVEDFEVFSFSAMTQDTLQRYAGVEDSDGIDVWGPPPMKVVGVLSWMWDHFNVNPWGKAAS